MLVDLKVAQLLCSRLCHDLVSPAGAVNTGLELITEGAAVAAAERAEAMTLVAKSARQVTRRLAFYRLAFGAGEGPRSLTEAMNAAADLLADGGVTLSPPERGAAAPTLSADGMRLLLVLILVAAGTLPCGGTVTVDVAALPEGVGIALTAAGRGAALRDDLRAALTEDVAVDALTPRVVHGYFARCQAAAMGTAVEWTAETDVVRLAAVVPTR
jgi:histidine phosphotransferase ChpT